ncbi:MAG: trypsin-like peptidase domain-containing protein [Ilumatobacteraceae bacterium]
MKLTEGDGTQVSYVATGAGSGNSASAANTDLHQLLAKAEPAVAAIEVASGSGTDVTPVAAGSGVVISADGLMLTNAHVVQVTDQLGNELPDPVFTVKMFDGTVRAAKVLGASADYDVALLQLDDTTNLHPLVLADTSTLRVGDDVVAIGNALDLGDAPTVTTGIVSALDRTLQESSSTSLHGLIQTDAAINHGNSGGALVNMNGELIGINSAGIPDAQNVGFAISVDTIKPLLDDLKLGKTVQASPIGYIGVTVAETPFGVTVTTVQDGTPAAKVGIKAGDIITTVAGSTVATGNQLSTVLRGTTPGSTVTVLVERDGKSISFDVTLAARPTN